MLALFSCCIFCWLSRYCYKLCLPCQIVKRTAIRFLRYFYSDLNYLFSCAALYFDSFCFVSATHHSIQCRRTVVINDKNKFYLRFLAHSVRECIWQAAVKSKHIWPIYKSYNAAHKIKHVDAVFELCGVFAVQILCFQLDYSINSLFHSILFEILAKSALRSSLNRQVLFQNNRDLTMNIMGVLINLQI